MLLYKVGRCPGSTTAARALALTPTTSAIEMYCRYITQLSSCISRGHGLKSTAQGSRGACATPRLTKRRWLACPWLDLSGCAGSKDVHSLGQYYALSIRPAWRSAAIATLDWEQRFWSQFSRVRTCAHQQSLRCERTLRTPGKLAATLLAAFDGSAERGGVAGHSHSYSTMCSFGWERTTSSSPVCCSPPLPNASTRSASPSSMLSASMTPC